MKFDINTLRRAVCAVIVSGLLILVGLTSAQAQGRHGNGYGRHDNYGQQQRARNMYRRDLRRDLNRHQRLEKQALRNRLRTDRVYYGNTSDYRLRRRAAISSMRVHRRAERTALRQTLRSNRRHGH